MAENTKLLNSATCIIFLKIVQKKLKWKRFILNHDLTFPDEENAILRDVIDFFCSKTEQFFEVGMPWKIVNEMRSLSSLSYRSSDVKVES